jgi:NADH dehydrogenase
MKRVLVLGAGFAGLWAAAAAARARHTAGREPDEIEILVLDRRSYHSIRVRNYEVALADTLIPLKSVFDPIDVCHVQGDITTIDAPGRTVGYISDGAPQTVSYDRLICALGSELVRPAIPGLAEYGFDIDTFPAAEKLCHHLATLPARTASNGQYAVLVVGAGLTGIEVAAEMPARLRTVIEHAGKATDAKPIVTSPTAAPRSHQRWAVLNPSSSRRWWPSGSRPWPACR